jgi:hypothetical protein
MVDRKRANLAAAVVAVVVFVMGIIVIPGDHSIERSTTTTTVAKSETPTKRSVVTIHKVLHSGGRKRSTTDTTTRTATPAVPASTEKTTVVGGRSFAERLLGEGGVVFLQIGVVLLAALIAAAAVQRVLMGQYGGVKAGAFGIEELAATSDKSVAELQTAMKSLQKATRTELASIKKDLQSFHGELASGKEASTATDAKLSEQLAILVARLATLEQGAQAEEP